MKEASTRFYRALESRRVERRGKNGNGGEEGSAIVAAIFTAGVLCFAAIMIDLMLGDPLHIDDNRRNQPTPTPDTSITTSWGPGSPGYNNNSPVVRHAFVR